MSTRSEANNRHFAIRRIPPASSHWRKAPPGSTSGAYRDNKSELSIDLDSADPKESIQKLQEMFKHFIEEKGIGLAYAQVEHINTALIQGRVEGGHVGIPVDEGKVLHDPIVENDMHGVITGKDSKNKGKLLQSTFKDILPPDENFFK